MRVVVVPQVEDALAALPDTVQAEVLATLRSIPAAFGQPHVHAGLGLRQLRRGVYEARIGLHLRAIFTRQGDALVVTRVGDHEDVQRYLRR